MIQPAAANMLHTSWSRVQQVVPPCQKAVISRPEPHVFRPVDLAMFRFIKFEQFLSSPDLRNGPIGEIEVFISMIINGTRRRQSC